MVCFLEMLRDSLLFLISKSINMAKASRAPAKKGAPKKAALKKAAEKKTTDKKSPSKKTAVKKAAVKKVAPKKAASKKESLQKASSKAKATKKIPAKKEPIIPAPVMQPSELTETAELNEHNETGTDTSAPVPQKLAQAPNPYTEETPLPQGKLSHKPVGKKNTMIK